MSLKSWETCLLDINKTLSDAISKLEVIDQKIILVTKNDNLLVGTITDGDIRRAILAGIGMSENIEKVANKNPVYVLENTPPAEINKIMKEKEVIQIPICKKNKKVIGLKTFFEESSLNSLKNPVFLMAGGFGKRLTPLTDNIPKPLLKVGSKPILQIILENFIDSGFEDFFISTHFMSQKIKDYFGNGKKWNVSIKYIDEKSPLGTAGALSLLPKKEINMPLIMMNGDLLTNVNFKKLLDNHNKSNSVLTVCISEHQIQIPYGVINKNKSRLVRIEEKPFQKFFINAGIYVLNPDIVKKIGKEKKMDMPSLIQNLIDRKEKVNIFPIHEYWLDIGRISEFQKANEDYEEI